MGGSARTEVEAEAAGWLARRESGAWSEQDAAALAAWLDADVGRRVAFLRLQAAWNEAGRLQALGAGWRAPGPPPRGYWTWPLQDRTGRDAALPAPPDLRGLRLAPRRRQRTSYAGRAFAAVSLATCLALTGWAWRSYHHVNACSYQTALGKLGTHALADGSQAVMSSASRLDVLMSRRERLIRLHQGEVIFDVSKDPGRPFVVDAGERRVVAVGTRFSVRRDGQGLRVVVTEGTVRLEAGGDDRASRPAALLPAGSMARVEGDAVLVSSPGVADAERLLDWRAGLLAFHDTPLADAVAEFNRYNARKLEVADAEAAALRIGGSFRWDNTDGFVRLLQLGFPLRAEAHPDRIVLRTR